MEKIICESTYFYGSCEESPNTFRIKFRLKDTVDGKLLQKAAERALKRYPYYSARFLNMSPKQRLKTQTKVL